MTARIRYAPLVALLLAAPTAPARAQDDAGGVAAPVMAPPAQAVTASGGGLSVSAQPDATLGRVAVVRGSAPATAAGRRVRLQLRDPETLRWSAVGHGRVARDGTFAAHWRPALTGPLTLRAVLRTASAPLSLTVYKAALATWYGPGMFGNLTACGLALTPDLQGVAHRTLSCGTPVQITFQGRTAVVPVVDRGPYGVPGAKWDLTQATAFALGMTETSTVGALAQPASK